MPYIPEFFLDRRFSNQDMKAAVAQLFDQTEVASTLTTFGGMSITTNPLNLALPAGTATVTILPYTAITPYIKVGATSMAASTAAGTLTPTQAAGTSYRVEFSATMQRTGNRGRITVQIFNSTAATVLGAQIIGSNPGAAGATGTVGSNGVSNNFVYPVSLIIPTATVATTQVVLVRVTRSDTTVAETLRISNGMFWLQSNT
jgi:hypothetical protein